MLQNITVFTLCALAAVVGANPAYTLQNNDPLTSANKGWNELLKGDGLFHESLNTIQVKSNNTAQVLDELNVLLGQDIIILKTVYQTYRKLYKDKYDTVSGNVEAFKEKLVEIARHNLEARSGRHSWWMGVNQFTDLTSAELRGVTGEQKYQVPSKNITTSPYVSPYSGLALPASFSSVDNGHVPPVRNQHGGASGELFAVTALAEIARASKGKRKGKGKNNLSLSVQQLIDCNDAFCASKKKLCKGTPIEKLLLYTRGKGLTNENSYPYKNPPEVGTCPTKLKVYISLEKPIVRTGNSEEELKQLLVDHGAVIVSLYFSDSMKNEYGGGVYPGSECGSNAPNQAVTLVGYGSYGGEDYWLLKNSWGQKWGEQGYLRLARNGGNVCGILGPAYAALAS